MTGKLLDRADFWKDFYSERTGGGRFMPPSQFAAFVSQEVPSESMIIDLGCGNGRDAVFFAALGIKTLGIDGSGAAISVAKNAAKKADLDGIDFIETKIDDALVEDILKNRQSDCICAYARFFLHAITGEEQASLFDLLGRYLTTDDMIAIEYRTVDDEKNEKEALPHYRRYQTSADVDKALEALGFTKIYGVEGRGFAKYKSEDAIVARGIYRK